MSIQTGKSPVRLGTTDIYDVNPGTEGFIKVFYDNYYVNKPLIMHLPIIGLPDEEVTIAEFIKEHRPQYATAHFGKWHMGPDNPGDQGYDLHDGPTTNTEGFQDQPDPKRINEVTARFVEFIQKQTAAEKPFFLQISHYAVHNPVLPSPKR
jgi:arylsulfatase A-like enzyme